MFSQEYLSLFHHSDQFDFCVFAMVHRLSYGAIMRTELFMYFCIKKYIWTQGGICRQLKIFYPPVVHATDHSKAVALPGIFRSSYFAGRGLRGAGCWPFSIFFTWF